MSLPLDIRQYNALIGSRFTNGENHHLKMFSCQWTIVMAGINHQAKIKYQTIAELKSSPLVFNSHFEYLDYDCFFRRKLLYCH